MDENQLNDLQQQVDDHEETISGLKNDLANLSNEFYKNNFHSSQDFQKYSRFNTRLKIPNNASLPATCHVSEICVSGGIVYVCSAANTWTKIGTQT